MYLKRLELQGFKSFAGHIELEFDGGITAVVGPNGSGKSNLADALRWALAEQSGRLLRTRKTEEAIFAGSSRRSSVGMAEVSVTFDNATAWLPVDFLEVVITRRAYRSGESDYFINRRRVRQKDVVELLLKGNVGQNSYTVMGQGLVEAALSLRPEERRNLIEEAADIKRHRLSLAESQDKLAATRANLERARLITQELEPQVARLRRQARRAQEQARLTTSLRSALAAWYGHLWRATQHSRSRAEAEAKRSTDRRRQLQEELIGAQEQLAQRRSELHELRESIAAQDARLREAVAEIQRLNQSLASQDERVTLAKRQRAEIALELQALEEEQAALRKQLKEAQEAIAQVQDEGEQRRQELAQHRQELAQLEADYQEKAGELVRAQRLEAQRVEEHNRMLSRLAQWEERCQQLAGQVQRDEERKNKLAQELALLSKELKARQDRDSALAQGLSQVAAAKDAQSYQEEQVRSSVAGKQEEVEGLQRRREGLENRLELLRQLSSQNQGLEHGAKSILQASHLEGILSTIAQEIQVPPGLERAIESVLEEHLHAIAVERRQHAFDALRYLAQNGGGRAALVPLDSLREENPASPPQAPGVIGIAGQLVTCAARYRGVMEALLGAVLVVEDLQSAQGLYSAWPGTVVTRRGEVLYPWGGVAGGTTANGDGDGVLLRERQLRELPQEIASLEVRIEQANARLQEERERLRRQHDTQAQLSGQERQLRADKAALAPELARLRRRWESSRSDLKAQIDTARQRQQEYEQAQSQRTELVRRREETSPLVETDLAPLDSLREAVAKLQEARSVLQSSIAEGSAQLTASGREQSSRESLVQSYRSSLDRLHSRYESVVARVRQLEREAQEGESRLAGERQQTGRLEAAAQELRQILAPLREREENLAKEEGLLVSQEATLQKDLLNAERAVIEGEGQVREAVRELDALKVSMQNDDITPEATTTSAEDPEVLKKRVERLRSQLRSLGYADPQVLEEYEEAAARYEFLTVQIRDLEAAEQGLLGAIAELQQLMERQFQETFQKVAAEFERYFTILFGGGTAQLVLTDPANPAATGVDVVARPPGKRIQNLALLSGGERALTAVALLFALLKTNPVPFCVLDEVDAALDEANTQRFAAVLRDLAQQTQFILITHNRITVEAARAIYGVSMGEDKVSRVLSLRLDDTKSVAEPETV